MSAEGNGKPGRDRQPLKKCLTPGCKARVGMVEGRASTGARGLCPTCHNSASGLVKKGKTTWEELERLNLAIPKSRSKLEAALYAKRLRLERDKDLPLQSPED